MSKDARSLAFHRYSQTVALSALLALGSPTVAHSLDFSGFAEIFATATDNNQGAASDLLQQQYNLGVFQRLTPYVSARLGFSYFDLNTKIEPDTDFTRRSRTPRIELLYNRDRLTGRLSAYKQFFDGTREIDQFEIDSFAANLSWKPRRGPNMVLNYSSDQNVADVSVFGRDISSERYGLDILYDRKHWSASYSLQQLAFENLQNELRTDQTRHQIRAQANRSFFSDALSLGVSGWFSQVDRLTRVGEDSEIAEPIPPVLGLFAIDTNPEIGELIANPTLIDGDTTSPASPPIDIGGANTFRNIGLDLGLTRPITRLEVSVDTVSGPQVTWQVYRSRDNLLWEPIPNPVSEFDPALLVYRLRFPETEDRYFKAVNISVNPVPEVLVTEIRALRDLDGSATEEDLEGQIYRADFSADYQPIRRFRVGVNFGASTDQDFADGLVRRDFQEVHANSHLAIDLTRHLIFSLGYRYADTEDRREPVLFRTTNSLSGSLRWNPLQTVDAVLTVGQQEESDRGELIQSNQGVRLGVVTDLLPDLRLITDLTYSSLVDPFAGRDRDTYAWRETLAMRPHPKWEVRGGFTHTLFETPESETLLSRTQYHLNTTWRATRFLVLGGYWYYTQDDGSNSFNQSYSLSYNPGSKLTITASYRESSTQSTIATSNSNISSSYRVTRRLSVFASFSNSRTFQQISGSLDVSSFRTGLRVSF